MCSTWRTSSKKLKSHQDGYGPTMAQLSNIVEFKTLEETKRCGESHPGSLSHAAHCGSTTVSWVAGEVMSSFKSSWVTGGFQQTHLPYWRYTFQSCSLATVALSVVHTKTLNIAAQVTYANEKFPIVCHSRGSASRPVSRNRHHLHSVTDNSPYWIYNESRDEEHHTKHNEEGVTEALVLGIVGQLGCLWGHNNNR